jgi:hypothetical protein
VTLKKGQFNAKLQLVFGDNGACRTNGPADEGLGCGIFGPGKLRGHIRVFGPEGLTGDEFNAVCGRQLLHPAGAILVEAIGCIEQSDTLQFFLFQLG